MFVLFLIFTSLVGKAQGPTRISVPFASLEGTIIVSFTNFDTPVNIEITQNNVRFIIDESNGIIVAGSSDSGGTLNAVDCTQSAVKSQCAEVIETLQKGINSLDSRQMNNEIQQRALQVSQMVLSEFRRLHLSIYVR